MGVMRSVYIIGGCIGGIASLGFAYNSWCLSAHDMRVYRDQLQKADTVEEAYQVTRETLQRNAPQPKKVIDECITYHFYDRSAQLGASEKQDADHLRKNVMRWLREHAYDVSNLPTYVDWKQEALCEQLKQMQEPDAVYRVIMTFMREYADQLSERDQSYLLEEVPCFASLSHSDMQDVIERLQRWRDADVARTQVAPIYHAYRKHIANVSQMGVLYTKTLQFLMRHYRDASQAEIKTFLRNVSSQLQQLGMQRRIIDALIDPLITHIEQILEVENYNLTKLPQDPRDFYVAVHREVVRPLETVEEVYHATRQLVQELPSSSERMASIYKNIMASQLAAIDARQARQLNRQLKQYMQRGMKPQAMPYAYDAFVQRVSAQKTLQQAYQEQLRISRVTLGQDLYQVTREFLLKRVPEPNAQEVSDLFNNVYDMFKGMFDNSVVQRVYVPVASGIAALLEQRGYHVQALPREYADFLIEAHAVHVAQETSREMVYTITRTMLMLAPQVSQVLDGILENLTDDSRLAQLLEQYIRGYEKPVQQLPQTYADFEQQMVRTIFIRTFSRTLNDMLNTADISEQHVTKEHAFHAMYQALHAVSEYQDITQTFVENGISPALRDVDLYTQPVKDVRHAIAAYLQMGNTFADLPDTYAGIQQALSGTYEPDSHQHAWLPEFKKLRNMLHREVAGADDALRVNKSLVAVSHVQNAIEQLYTMWNISKGSRDTYILREGVTADHVLATSLERILQAIRHIVAHRAETCVYNNMQKGNMPLHGFVSQLYNTLEVLQYGSVITEYMRDIINTYAPYTLQFDVLYHTFAAYGMLIAYDAMVRHGAHPTCIETEEQAHIFQEHMVQKLPEDIPEFVQEAGQRFDVRLSEYLKKQIIENGRANRINYADAGSIPSLIRTYHNALPQELRQDEQFESKQYYLGYYLRNAHMMLQNGRDIVQVLNNVAGNVRNLPRENASVVEPQSWIFTSVLPDFVAVYNARIKGMSLPHLDAQERRSVRENVANINMILQQLQIDPGRLPDARSAARAYAV